ncbi:MAG: phosphatidylserine decarboxylase [Clostridiales bacterium]|nr:phosphatidylserine decarboxylase [Clostridiales bacterium]
MRETVEKPPVPKSLRFLYYNKFGGLVLRMITRRWVSRLAGSYLDSRLSKRKIKKYIKKHGINMSDFIEEDYRCFNAFFTRRIKPELRPFDLTPSALISPCDAKVSAYRITEDCTFNVKGFDYTVESLLKNAELAKKYDGGIAIVFRLTVTDYHRYFFFDGGTAECNTFIKGRLHTVQPVALEKRRVFTENCREYTILKTDNFGDAVQVEVGAMMVGRIVNDVKEGRFERGEEKGRFEFGGSTVILLLEKDRAVLDEEFFENTEKDVETIVKCGEKIGVAATGKNEIA